MEFTLALEFTFSSQLSFSALSKPGRKVSAVEIIYLSAQQENINAEVKPEHQQCDRSQTAIHGKSVKIFHINGKSD